MTREQEDFVSGLHSKYAAAMQQISNRRLGDYELSRDLIQETFLVACTRIDDLCIHPHPERWLFTTLHHLIERECAKAYHSEVEMGDDDYTGLEDVELPLEDVLPVGLTEKERQLIIWRLELGLSYEEVAERLAVSTAACRKQMSRALQRCRELYEFSGRNL